MKILVIGDVCGEPGVEFLSKNLRKLKQREQADLVIVNGENASMRGISPAQADEILYSGADVITLGNHAFANRQSWDYLDETRDVIRPLNLSPKKPGMGYTVVECCGKRVCVVNLMGQLNMDFSVDSPFRAMDALLKQQDADVYVVDFHAEATSEKKAFAYGVAGRVAAVFGTHTHVPTADEQVLPGGTGFISDIGMTGGIASVIGVKWQQSLEFFTGGLGQRFQSSNEDLRIQGAVFTLDGAGKCTEVRRVECK